MENRLSKDVLVTEVENRNLPKAVVFGDSDLNFLKPFLSEHFAKLTYKTDMEFDPELILKEQPNTVVMEVPERLIGLLMNPMNLPDESKDSEPGDLETSNDIQLKEPIITTKTLLNPETAVLVGNASEGTEVEVQGGLEVVRTSVTGGKFIIQVKLKPGSNHLSMVTVDRNGRQSQPVSLTMNSNPSAPTKPVVVGKEGWLFLQETLPDYTGSNLFSDAELDQIQRNLEEKQNWLAEKNIAFLVVVAPNPLSVYPEYGPEGMNEATNTRLDQLTKFLQVNTQIEFLNLEPSLAAQKDLGRLYHKTDSHWNELGAFIGYSEMMKKLEEILPGSKRIALGDYGIQQSSKNGGDLLYYLGLRDSAIKEQSLQLLPKFPLRSNFVKGNGENNSSNINIPKFASVIKDEKLPKAVMYRDSFATNLLPYLSESFERILYEETWNVEFNPKTIDAEAPDVVILELTERNLHLLLNDNPPGIKQ